jgi:transcriptional regulator with XRE-family HTH domain
MPKKPTPRPSQVFASRLREVRERRRWSQQDLCDHLARIGAPTDKATIARTETGKRGISLDDAVMYAAALGPSLLNLTLPLDPVADVALAPKKVVAARAARRWLYGQQTLPGHDDIEDRRIFLSEVPHEELNLLERHGLQSLLSRAQALYDAFTDRDMPQAEHVLNQLDQALQLVREEVASERRR